VRLSQQALVDCSWGFGNNGCDGGEDFRAYQWMIKHGGIPTEASYGPYLGQDSYCNLNKSTMGLKIKGWVNVTSGDLEGMKVAIAAHGPVSVAIDASHKSLGFYSNGVYYEEDCNNDVDGLDHAVLAVGYGEILGMKYWLVKKSWSTYWGNDGYVLMTQKDNNCGMATAATYVVPDTG
jgi:C1A family cysteine protease